MTSTPPPGDNPRPNPLVFATDGDDDGARDEPSSPNFTQTLRRQMHRVRHYHHGRRYILNKRHTSMYCLPGDSELRMKIFEVVDSRAFIMVINVFIALNTVMVVLDTPGIRDLKGLNTTLFAFDVVFQIVFTVEMALKMLALGVALHRHSFFRSPQNTIDCLIVVVGFVVFFVVEPIAVRLVRLTRSLRVLNAFARVHLLRSIFIAMRNGIPRMRDVMLLLSFVVTGMGVLGLQLFVGTLHQKCYINLPTGVGNATTPILDPSDLNVLCSLNPGSGHRCRDHVECTRHDDIFFTSYVNYDNIGHAIFAVFRSVTMDNWPSELKLIQESNGVSYFMYSSVIVLFGAFFAINLVLAILSGEYEEVVAEQKERDERNAEIRLRVLEQQAAVANELSITGQLMQMAEEVSELRVEEWRSYDIIRNEIAPYEQVLKPIPLDEQGEPVSIQVGGASKSGVIDVQSSGTTDNVLSPLSPKSDAGANLCDVGSHASNVSGTQRLQRSLRERAPTQFGSKPFDQADPMATLPPPKPGFEWRERDLPCTTRARLALLNNVVSQSWFRYVSLVVTIINVIVLATDHHGIDPTWEAVNYGINAACTCYFILEACVKIPALLGYYFRDPFNVLDIALVAMAIPDFVLSAGTNFTALRAIRLLRILRILRTSKKARQVIQTVGNAAAEASVLALFMFVFIVVFALFATITFSSAVDVHVRPNYTTFANSLLAFFIILTGENWVDETVKVMLGASWPSVFFFLIFFIFGNYILLNFVIVILINGYNTAAQQVRDEESAQVVADADAIQIEIEGDRAEAEDMLTSKNFVPLSPGPVDPEDTDAIPPPSAQKGESDFFSSDNDDQETQQRSSPGAAGERGNKGITFNNSADKRAGDGEHRSSRPPTGDSNHSRRGSRTLRGMSREEFRDVAQPEGGEEAPASPQDSSANAERPGFMMLQLRRFAEFSFAMSLAKIFGLPVTDEEIFERVDGDSMKIFSKDNAFRRGVARMVMHPYFELVVVLVIIESCVVLMFDNDSSRESDSTARLIDANSIFLVVFFTIEMLLKWVAYGVFIGKHAYFSDNWHRMDCFVLVVSIIALFFKLRAVQSLRIFRLGAKWTSLRLVITSLVRAFPGLLNVFLLTLFFVFVCGIVMVAGFKGQMVSCTDPSVTHRVNCVGFFNETETLYDFTPSGVPVPVTYTKTKQRLWQFSFYNFNNLGEAVLSMVVFLYGDGWSAILFQGMDTVSYDEAMRENASAPWAIVFVLIMCIMNFFINNLFVGSLMDSFSAERNVAFGKTDEDGHPLLSDAQERWIREFRFASVSRLPRIVPPPKNPIREAFAKLYFADKDRLGSRTAFEVTITILIMINAIIMCTEHDGQPDYWRDFLFWASVFFQACFTVEFIIKIIAMLPLAYFADPWNRFDFLILIAGFISLIFTGPGTNAIRIARVARVLRLVKRARGLDRLFQSLIYALPQLFNVTCVLLLFLFVFAVFGTSLFSRLHVDNEDNQVLSEFFNFRNAGFSIMLLFQIGTGEAWADVLAAGMMNEETSDCSEAAGTCGTWLAIPFFILFMLCANSVAINLFTFIVVDNYMEVNQITDKQSQRLLFKLRRFREMWAKIDLERTGSLRWEHLVVIIRQLYEREELDDALFAEEWGDDDDDDANKDDDAMGTEDDVSDDDEPASPGVWLRPTSADFRNDGFVKAMSKAVGIREQKKAEHQPDASLRELRHVKAITDSFFLHKLSRMDIPVGHAGMVAYSDCLYGLTREYYYDEEEEETEHSEKFITSLVQFDRKTVFMVHHALAVRKIQKALRRRRRIRAGLQPEEESTAVLPDVTLADDEHHVEDLEKTPKHTAAPPRQPSCDLDRSDQPAAAQSPADRNL